MEHSPGPVVLGLLATGKGNARQLPGYSAFRAALWAGAWEPNGRLSLIACCGFYKVWTAWLGFVLERRRKKARLEQAVQVYHQQLLQEGATRLLRFAAAVKASRQQVQAQQQVQVSQGCWRGAGRAGQDLMRSCVAGSPQPPLCSPPLC